MVSLDFEGYWGTRDIEPLADCRNRIGSLQSVVTSLLNAFQEHEVHATWASVGFLFTRSREQLLELLPAVRPNYSSPKLSPYRDLDLIGANEDVEPSCYAGSSI